MSAGRISKFGIHLSKIPLESKYKAHIEFLRNGGCKGGYSPSPYTLIRYTNAFKYIQVFQELEKNPKPIEEWKRAEFESFKNFLRKYKYESSVIHNVFGVIGSYFSYLYYMEKIPSDQIVLLSKIPKPAPNQRDDQPIKKQEWDIIFNELLPKTRYHIRNKAYFKILQWTGRRASEPLFLMWEDIDFERGLIAFTRVKGGKRKKTEYSILFPELKEVLLDYANAISEAYPNVEKVMGKGCKYTGKVFEVQYPAFYEVIRSKKKKYPELNRIYLHLFRASMASDFYAVQRDTVAIQEIGGWSSDAWRRYVRNIGKGVKISANEFYQERFEVEG